LKLQKDKKENEDSLQLDIKINVISPVFLQKSIIVKPGKKNTKQKFKVKFDPRAQIIPRSSIFLPEDENVDYDSEPDEALENNSQVCLLEEVEDEFFFIFTTSNQFSFKIF